MAIEWGGIRQRGRTHPYATGPVADFLLLPEIANVTHTREGELDRFSDDYKRYGESPLDRLESLAYDRLRRYGLGGAFFDRGYLTDVWGSIGPRVRQALICLEILSDRGCRFSPQFKPPFPVGFHPDKPMFGLPGTKSGRQAFWQILIRSASGTTHLIRPGGLAETDLGWMAGAKTRGARRWVRERLEQIGAIRRLPSKGQTRYLPTTPSARTKLRIVGRATGHVTIRSIGRLALASAPGRSDSGARVNWRRVNIELRPSYVIGPPPSPAALRHLEKSLAGFNRAILRTDYKWSPNWTREERAFRNWCVGIALRRKTEISGVTSALLIPLD